ncbi:MAG: Rho termination factor N-terminal domain-containing protein, partial [Holdemanella sp.]|nr:Rho termination factor N-terminal domain-containing protein [Holdemanella sp.]
MTKEELENSSLVDLRILAKEKGIKSVTTLRKSELIEELLELEAPKQEEPVKKEMNISEEIATGILEVLPDGFGFLRCDNYLSGENDVYLAHSQIRRFNLKTGDVVSGKLRQKNPTEKYGALAFINSINGINPEVAKKRKNFEDLTPIYPDKRIVLEQPFGNVSMRIMDLLSPIGKGQRGL